MLSLDEKYGICNNRKFFRKYHSVWDGKIKREILFLDNFVLPHLTGNFLVQKVNLLVFIFS